MIPRRIEQDAGWRGQAAPGLTGLSPASLDGPWSIKSPLFPAERALPETSKLYGSYHKWGATERGVRHSLGRYKPGQRTAKVNLRPGRKP